MSSKIFLYLILLFASARCLDAQKFLPDDPLIIDNDSLVDVAEPLRRGLSDYYDFLQHTFRTPGELTRAPATNVNTLGEVPDSSWFQNRHGGKRMSIEELVRGPNQSDGPSREGQWTVTEGKTEGITPGFRIRDKRGDLYLVKFDPPGNSEMATAAEIISTKFFYAAGFNVPENYLVYFRRSDLVVDAAAKISIGLGPRRQMTESDIDGILARVDKSEDGRYRAVASKFLAGRPIGPFKYYGTRSDDANDVIPHEHRRELRGLGVLSAWLNHDDSRAVNTLDTVVTIDGRRSVRHYLIDFGSTLGSGSVAAQKPRAGWEYIWEPAPVFRRILTLGLWDSPWIRIDYPDMSSIGRFESKVFDAETWKPEYPNPAFMNARRDDSYWAAKIVMSFTDGDIRAIVRTGGLSDAQAEEYMVNTLIERRNKIGRDYLTRLSSLDNFRLTGSMLEFDHLASLHGFSPRPGHRFAWFRFNNDRDEKQLVETEFASGEATVPIPAALQQDSSPYFGVDIESDAGKVSVFLHRSGSQLRIVGVERSWNGQ